MTVKRFVKADVILPNLTSIDYDALAADAMSQLAYATLQEAREKELSYIASQLRQIRAREGKDTDLLLDLRAWLKNRRTCFATQDRGGERGT